MRIRIQVLDDELACEHVEDVPLAMAHEFKVLFNGLEVQQPHTLASMISGLISIGIDVAFGEYIERNLQAHFRQFDMIWRHTSGRCFRRTFERTKERYRRDGHGDTR